jgi:ABC-type bacteriocin/lantibiotic exporter with double-glycine peptidase domain
VREEQTDITSVYFYAALNGFIQLSLPVGIQAIIGFVLGGVMSTSLVLLISLVVLGVLAAGLMQANQMKVIEKIQQKIFVRYAFAFAERIPQLDLKKVNAFYLPELVNRFFDTMSLQKSLSKLLLELPTAMIQILFGLLLLSFYHPSFIFFGILLIATLWLILHLSGSKGLQTSLTESTHKYALAGWFEEMARVVQSFKFSIHTGLHLQKADAKAISYLDARKRHFSILLLQYRILIAFKVLITAAILVVGVVLLLNQQINIGQFIAAEIIIITIINSVEKVIINIDGVYDVLTSVEKVSKLTDKPVETSGTYQLETSGGVGVQGQNLQFGYDPERPVIQNLSFSIQPGEKVCLSGNDGSGKSTLLRLLTGSYKDFGGSILINGVPIDNYDLVSLRSQTGILFPHENIFHGTMWDNIVMGNKAIDRRYVNYLADRIGLLAFISGLKQGYDTELDPGGNRLPLNVVRKILLVRALAHQPKLLLLEEPWQGIEEQYKLQIQDLLLHHLPGATVVISTTEEPFARQCSQAIKLK